MCIKPLRFVVVQFFVITTTLSALLFSCGVPKPEHEAVLSENKKLTEEVKRMAEENKQMAAEIEQYKNTPDKIGLRIQNYLKENNIASAKSDVAMLYKYHPEYADRTEIKALISAVDKAEKESIRLANLKNTGIWILGQYVDEFDTPTGKKYIANSGMIKGRFSNTATQNSDLNVKIISEGPSEIAIKLYEYARDNPVKTVHTPDDYSVQVMDKDGGRYKLKAQNWSERLLFGKADSKTVHSILMKGGNIKFNIVNERTYTTTYSFEISNADWYENAYAQLIAK